MKNKQINEQMINKSLTAKELADMLAQYGDAKVTFDDGENENELLNSVLSIDKTASGEVHLTLTNGSTVDTIPEDEFFEAVNENLNVAEVTWEDGDVETVSAINSPEDFGVWWKNLNLDQPEEDIPNFKKVVINGKTYTQQEIDDLTEKFMMDEDEWLSADDLAEDEGVEAQYAANTVGAFIDLLRRKCKMEDVLLPRLNPEKKEMIVFDVYSKAGRAIIDFVPGRIDDPAAI